MLSGTQCDSWGCTVKGWELDLMISVGPFQLRIFFDSVIHLSYNLYKHFHKMPEPRLKYKQKKILFTTHYF